MGGNEGRGQEKALCMDSDSGPGWARVHPGAFWAAAFASSGRWGSWDGRYLHVGQLLLLLPVPDGEHVVVGVVDGTQQASPILGREKGHQRGQEGVGQKKGTLVTGP